MMVTSSVNVVLENSLQMTAYQNIQRTVTVPVQDASRRRHFGLPFETVEDEAWTAVWFQTYSEGGV